jgi:hypothetical protein
MRIESVITCVGYSDFLAYALPINKAMVDYLVVVTSTEDKKTQRLCEFLNVRCVVTDKFNTSTGFSKGAGINEGLAVLKKDGMVLHMDADIVLPPLFRQVVDQADLDPHYIYGCDRFMVPSFEAWQKFLIEPSLQHENSVYLHTNAFEIGTRIVSPDYGGYVPIGYWQLWNPAYSKVTTYPAEHTSAGRGDMLFAKNWPRNKRAHLADLVVYHLESEQGPQGMNWNKRVSAPFAPKTNTQPWVKSYK